MLLSTLPADTVAFATRAPEHTLRRHLPRNPVRLGDPAPAVVTRTSREVGAHISTVECARDRLGVGDLWDYWSIIRPLVFGGPADQSAWNEEQPIAAEFSRRTLPWGHDLTAADRTLVVTGGRNAEYEAIASRLAGAGATHVVLAGHGHRAQDHPGFADAAEAFLER